MGVVNPSPGGLTATKGGPYDLSRWSGRLLDGRTTAFSRGDIAQLGERGVRNAEVGGSTPPISTKCPCSSEDRAAAS